MPLFDLHSAPPVDPPHILHQSPPLTLEIFVLKGYASLTKPKKTIMLITIMMDGSVEATLLALMVMMMTMTRTSTAVRQTSTQREKSKMIATTIDMQVICSFHWMKDV